MLATRVFFLPFSLSFFLIYSRVYSHCPRSYSFMFMYFKYSPFVCDECGVSARVCRTYPANVCARVSVYVCVCEWCMWQYSFSGLPRFNGSQSKETVDGKRARRSHHPRSRPFISKFNFVFSNLYRSASIHDFIAVIDTDAESIVNIQQVQKRRRETKK